MGEDELNFENLSVTRVIIHQVFKRKADRQIQQPRYGAALQALGPEDTAALEDRIVSALGSPSRCMGMSLLVAGAGSAFQLARALADCDDALFVHHSRQMANLLAHAQERIDLPGGIVVVFSGSMGHPAQRIMGVIKAEAHSGFSFPDTGVLALTFLRNLVLTPGQKLYKMGVFVEVDPNQSNATSGNGWEAFLYDETAIERNKAAQYFYSTFLGLGIPVDSAQQTKSFYELTKKFITDLDVPEARKVELNTGLFSYLKVEQTPTIDRSTFATRFFATPEAQDAFTKYMDKNNFPAGAINKDISQIASLLRRRNFVFASDVRLSVPADSFEDLVKIEPIEGEPSADGSIPQWTKITVRDRLKSDK
ncbi:hypothetical protein EAS62_26550 [Bradyrhizobium zhanjiangense]|uniref:Nucleoid-associated protein n=1 Tax=Bradyrhizobium zhanjiangense TaxID=1325107 RepID=A0ABY0DEC9_9BRAD|nr:hypothetical protein EAS62_26550 [Bradyrhizobium zhanjiangense]